MAFMTKEELSKYSKQTQMKNLKLSNIFDGNVEYLRLKLRKTSSPGKAQLLNDIQEGDYPAVIRELLYRFELYCSEKILNYTKRDINIIMDGIFAHGLDVIVNATVEKYIKPSNTEREYEGFDFRDENLDVSEFKKALIELNSDLASFEYVEDDGCMLLMPAVGEVTETFLIANDIRDDVFNVNDLISQLEPYRNVDFLFDFDGEGDFQIVPTDEVKTTNQSGNSMTEIASEISEHLMEKLGVLSSEFNNFNVKDAMNDLGYNNLSITDIISELEVLGFDVDVDDETNPITTGTLSKEELEKIFNDTNISDASNNFMGFEIEFEEKFIEAIEYINTDNPDVSNYETINEYLHNEFGEDSEYQGWADDSMLMSLTNILNYIFNILEVTDFYFEN